MLCGKLYALSVQNETKLKSERKHENPLLHIPADIHQHNDVLFIASPFNMSTPIEALHTLVLGAIKYLLLEVMPMMMPGRRKRYWQD